MDTFVDEPTRQYRDALRLLFILARAGEPVTESSAPLGSVKVITSQKKLQKIDFWIRNPDHLANVLLDLYEKTSNSELLQFARQILDSGEPEFRRDEMVKYMFGAYEPIDTGMAPLVSYGLAKITRVAATNRRWFFLLERGAKVADEMESGMIEAKWYSQRASFIGNIFGELSGEDLARLQYQEPEYANATLGETIASIADKVRARIFTLGFNK